MSRKYWVISPNVWNDETEQSWKDWICKKHRVAVGYRSHDTNGKAYGYKFANEIKIGDIVLVAQGANWQKNCFLLELLAQMQKMIQIRGGIINIDSLLLC